MATITIEIGDVSFTQEYDNDAAMMEMFQLFHDDYSLGDPNSTPEEVLSHVIDWFIRQVAEVAERVKRLRDERDRPKHFDPKPKHGHGGGGVSGTGTETGGTEQPPSDGVSSGSEPNPEPLPV